MNREDLLHGLNAEQRQAVEHEAGPLLIVAGPGTGKTRVLTRRMAYSVVARGTPSRRILATTFTTRAAGEMRERVADLLGSDEQVRIGTFHWVSHAILRRHGQNIGLKRNFHLLSPSESRLALRRSIVEARLQHHRAALVYASVSLFKNGADAAEAVAGTNIGQGHLLELVRRYDAALRSAGAVDLDDLQRLAAQLLQESTAVRRICQASFDEILVDEYQDVNPIQHCLLTLLAPVTGRVTVVGDDDQSIYSWRQAKPDIMLRFGNDFTGAGVVRLDQTYRSSKHIIRAAASLVSHNTVRIDKALRTDNTAGPRVRCIAASDERDEAERVADGIERLTASGAVRPQDVAVLYRVNAQSRPLEDALVRRGITYHVHAGPKFYDRAEIMRSATYLRLVLDPSDREAMGRLLSGVPGVGEVRREMLLRKLDESTDARQTLHAALPAVVSRRVSKTIERLNDLHSLRHRPLADLVRSAGDIVLEEIDEGFPGDREAAEENLAELRAVGVEFGARRSTLRDFIDRVVLSDESDNGRDTVSLMSLHASKGLEFDAVFIVGLEEGILPHRRSWRLEVEVEEERRLLYVGMTRARRNLCLSFARSRTLGGLWSGGVHSRFISEIGSVNLQHDTSFSRHPKPRLFRVGTGDRVLHPRWQAGTVTAVEGEGRDTMVTIAFDAGFRQRLLLCHAPLTRMEDEMKRVNVC